jgi:large subunit ribosomal protein L30
VSAGAAGSHLRVTQVRSAIATKPKHRATLRAMGLRGVGRSRVLADGPVLQGMLRRVRHLVTVDVADEAEVRAQDERSAAALAARRASQGTSGTAARPTTTARRRAAKETA